MPDEPGRADPARAAAIKRIQQKRNFQRQLFVFLVINVFLWILWAVTGLGFPWPIFVTVGWGFGLVMQAWAIYRENPISEADIAREMQRGQGGDPAG